MEKTERLLAITLLLQARGKMTARHLADILGVSTRTIYRDIDTLSLAHIPISMDYGPGGGYYLPGDYHFESTIFTPEEAVSLVLSADMAGNYSLFADDDGLQRALLKLEAALPEQYRVDVKAARKRILFDTTAWYDRAGRAGRSAPVNSVFLESIRLAVLGENQLEILYPANDAPGVQWLRVDPYGLVYKGLSRRRVRTGIWYLVAYCHNCHTFCTFRVGYIEDLRVLDAQANIQPDFDLRSYWQEARQYLEEQTHPFALVLRVQSSTRPNLSGDTTILQEEPDGSIVVQVNVESLEAAISYVLALGTGATVLSPSNMRAAVAEAARSIAEMYD
ncbi:MAG TPA: YafY family protein [Ktedonobacteraceae bacterium]|nr:YafY family protein [Ktedonobacteraceae bacterium]